MVLKAGLCFFGLAIFTMTGCASAEDRSESSLLRQQSATIESLRQEILRLNQEMDGMADSREELLAGQPELENALVQQIARGDVRVALESKGLVVTVLDHALFDPDETQFTPGGEEILKRIAAVLSRDLREYFVTLEGHTDDQPIDGDSRITNWEYSIGRASAVLHYFLEVEGLAPQRFGVSGYAEYRPVSSNATEVGRDSNRRVEIVLMPQKTAAISGKGA